MTDASASPRQDALWLGAAKVAFIGFGLLQQLVLPHLILPAAYGRLAVALSLISMVSNVAVTTALQGASRPMAQANTAAGALWPQLWAKQSRMGLGLAAAFLTLSPILSWLFVGSFEALPLLAIGALIIALYASYATLVGALNGLQFFRDQGLLDIGYGALRTGAMVLGASLAVRASLDPALPALVGFLGAALTILPVAYLLLRRRAPLVGDAPSPAPMTQHLGFLATLAAGQIGINLLLQVDFLMLSAHLTRIAGWLGITVSVAQTDQGLAWVSVARNARLYAFLPYQLLIALGFALFPVLARLGQQEDKLAAARAANQGLRIALLLCGAMGAVLMGLSGPLLRFLFPEFTWQHGAGYLALLAPGLLAFSLLSVAATALISLGHEKLAARATFLALGLVASVGATALLSVQLLAGRVLALGLERPGLFGAAGTLGTAPAPMIVLAQASLWASAAGTSLALVLASVGVWRALQRQLPGAVPWVSFIRAAVASGLAALLALQGVTGPGRWEAHHGRLGLPLVSLGVVLIYLVLMRLLGERLPLERGARTAASRS